MQYEKTDIFLSIFSLREYEERIVIPEGSVEQGVRAIELLEQRYFAISEEVKQKIILLYQTNPIHSEDDLQGGHAVN
jgi:hypothetical protein